MFDRKVHYLNEKGVLIRVDPFQEYFAKGYPNMLTRNGKCFTDNGEPYSKDKAPDEWKQLYPDYFYVKPVETKVPQEPVNVEAVETKVSPVVKRRGRPKRTETPKEV